MAWKDILRKNVGKGSSATYFPAISKAATAAKTAGTKAIPIIKNVGAAAAPVLGKAASGMATAGSAAQGVWWGAGAATGASALNAIADPGFVLFIAGLLTFFFSEYFGSVALAVIIGTIFMFYSALFIFKAKGIMVAVIFWVWYILFQGNINPQALLYMILPLLIIGMVVHGLVRKFQQGSFGEGASGEIIGLVPVLFFFLDFGLIDLLVQTFGLPLTPVVKNLILFTPWWALLGLFTTTKENFIISVFRIAGIVYVAAILTLGVVPDAYGKYKEDSLIPGPEQFLEAKKELREQLPRKENPAWSNLACIFSDPANVQSCAEQRQELSELTYICEKVENKEQGTPQFIQCIEEQRKKKKDASLQVQGVIDPTIKEPTTADIVAIKESFPTTYNPLFPFPFELKIENPRKLPLSVGVSCYFEGKSGIASVEGRIEGAPPVSFSDATFKSSYLCLPNEGEMLNGRYKIWFNATIKDIVTVSRLQRAFVGNKTPEEVNRLRREEIARVITVSESLAPADFAHINFNVGHAPKETIIENKPYKNILLTSNIENIGTGKLSLIKSYSISMGGFVVNDAVCVSGGQFTDTSKAFRNIPLPTCSIVDYPAELKNPAEWVPQTFEATLVYDYTISESADIEIKPPPS